MTKPLEERLTTLKDLENHIEKKILLQKKRYSLMYMIQQLTNGLEKIGSVLTLT